jgi:hypothetical protein
MMMQMLEAGGIPVAFTDSRGPDSNNPKGYFELEGGKIINRIMQGTFLFESYKGRFIKITAYGLLYLPSGTYKIIYMERNLDEVLDSMEKMAQFKDGSREETKQSFRKLNEKTKKELAAKAHTDVLIVNHNDVFKDPHKVVERVCDFIGPYSFDTPMMIAAVDGRLYRQRRDEQNPSTSTR